jgi:hypothetical protein
MTQRDRPYLPICAGGSGDIAGRWAVEASYAGTQTVLPVVGLVVTFPTGPAHRVRSTHAGGIPTAASAPERAFCVIDS